jgi:phage repressor protein C with HTH and peptisase S24 domain
LGKNLEYFDFSTRLKNLRKALVQTQAEFAENVGIPRTSLFNYEKGVSIPPGDFIVALKRIFNINLDWFLTGVGEMFSEPLPSPSSSGGMKQIPIFSSSELPDGAFLVPLLDQQLSAGSGADVPEEDVAKGLIPVPQYLSQYGKDIKALTVDGDSMYPTLHRGDMAVCDSCGWSGEGVYAVRMNGKGFVKRVTQRPGKVVLLSDNPKYPPLEEPEGSQDIEIVGRVHCAITKVD